MTVKRTKTKSAQSGASVKRTEVPIKKSEEGLSKYTLSDGTILTIKQIVFSVTRLEGAYNPAGDPVYEISGSSVVHAKVPKKLRKN